MVAPAPTENEVNPTTGLQGAQAQAQQGYPPLGQYIHAAPTYHHPSMFPVHGLPAQAPPGGNQFHHVAAQQTAGLVQAQQAAGLVQYAAPPPGGIQLQSTPGGIVLTGAQNNQELASILSQLLASHQNPPPGDPASSGKPPQ